jgi:Mg2+ and Co2+ transporter CorA
MANLKRVEKRLENVEAWMKEFEKGTGPAQTMDNMNWLVGQSRMLGERNMQHESMVTQLQQALQSNNDILNKFLEEHDMVRDWQGYIEEIQKENQENALQEQEAESLDAQEQAKDGEEVGEGDAEEA